MKRTDLGSLVTVAANIGVIVGIIFLGVEIRGNTMATQAANIQFAAEMDQSSLISIGSNSEVSRIWSAYLSAPETLTDAERIQGNYIFAALVRRLENVLLQYELGTLSEEGWQSRQALFEGMASTPGYAVYRKSRTARFSGTAITEHLERLYLSQQ